MKSSSVQRASTGHAIVGKPSSPRLPSAASLQDPLAEHGARGGQAHQAEGADAQVDGLEDGVMQDLLLVLRDRERWYVHREHWVYVEIGS